MERVITSASHPLVGYLKKMKEKKSLRYERREVLVEGAKLVRELCSYAPVKLLILQEDATIDSAYENAQEQIFVSENIIKKISSVEQSDGVMALIAMPEPKPLLLGKPLLALDRVSDPGNLGSLIRTAHAFSFGGLFLLEGCCDPYNDKALRAARGATFRLPTQEISWSHLKAFVQEQGYLPAAADIAGEPIDAILGEKKTLLILGNEGDGLSVEAKELCRTVTIPMNEEAESLNVAAAGAVIMYLLSRV